jgi:anaerobic selenocysteine-containing dehydrogenase
VPIFTTACPCNCYSTCSMRVEVENGRICRLEPHPDNAATPGGLCLKGLSYAERITSPDRLLYPMARTPGSTSFQRITWDEALGRIAEKLQHLRESVGPQSILYYAASGTKGLLNSAGMNFWRLFGGCTTTYGDLCWPAGLEATRLTLGENKHNAPWDLAHARLILLWGKNPAETNIHQMPFVERALEDGARLVVIDPRRTESAERAELLIQPRPGSDGALALGIAHLLLKNGRIDHAFIERHVHGFGEFSLMVEEMTPERAAELTDVPVRYLERLAGYLGEIKPATICAGFGMQRYTNSGQTMRAMIALLAITGNIGAAGAGWQFANLQSAVFDPVRDPVASFPPEEPDGIVRVSISPARLGQDMLATSDPELKMIWVERGNPVTQNPETHTVLKAIRALEFRVVIDQFLTDTAREADLLLPAKTLFEQSDVIGAYWHSYLQLRQKVLDPPAEVKPETEIYRLLARRLGLPEALVTEHIPGPSDDEIDAWLARKLAPFPEITLEHLRSGPVMAPGSQEIAFSDFVFPTPSGKIELVSQEAATRWGVDALPRYREPEESCPPSAASSSPYPLHFLTPNTKNRIHSQFGNLKMIRAVAESFSVTLSAVDAAERGIFDGDPVRIFNGRGSLEAPAHIDFSLKPGCVSMINGTWISEGGTVNYCSSGRATDMGHGAAFHDNLVQVEKVQR